jgi:hypothetical protein
MDHIRGHEIGFCRSEIGQDEKTSLNEKISFFDVTSVSLEMGTGEKSQAPKWRTSARFGSRTLARARQGDKQRRPVLAPHRLVWLCALTPNTEYMYQRNETKKKHIIFNTSRRVLHPLRPPSPFSHGRHPCSLYNVSQRTSRPMTDLPRQLGMIGRYIEVLKISRFPGPRLTIVNWSRFIGFICSTDQIVIPCTKHPGAES